MTMALGKFSAASLSGKTEDLDERWLMSLVHAMSSIGIFTGYFDFAQIQNQSELSTLQLLNQAQVCGRGGGRKAVNVN